MSIYQAPQVPQPAVTFGGGNYVDLSTVNMLQAQNAALQQENVALKSANQSLQQQRENPLCKAANRAYLREFTAYKTESLVEFPDGRYHLVKENPLGELYKVVKPVSDCTEFSARYAIDPRDGSTSIEVRYRLPIFPSILKALKSSTSANVRMLGNRLEPLLQHDVFERRQNGSFSLPISPHIHIFDVSSYPDTIRTTLAELLLYDWFRSARALQIPIVIMVDEVQNLRLGRGTVLNRIITEGRKFSIGSILISQSLKGFAPDEQLALSQTGTKLFFKPPLTEIRACSEMLAEPVRRSGTVELLKKLKVGQCLLLSDFTYIGDSLQPSSDCIQVSISLPTSIIK